MGNMVDKITADPTWNARIREAAGELYDGPYGCPEVELKNYPNVASNADSSWTRVKQSHMGNFFKCIETGAKPISDVVTVGNGTITCHLANIALRLGREADLGSGEGDIRWRRRSQCDARPRATQRVRDPRLGLADVKPVCHRVSVRVALPTRYWCGTAYLLAVVVALRSVWHCLLVGSGRWV